MTDLGDRLAQMLHDAVPEPPHELDPTAIRATPVRRERRKRVLAAALAAAAVAAVAIGVSLAGHQLARHQQPGVHGPAVPPPAPGNFSAREFRMAPPPQYFTGGLIIPRATCTPQQIRATAATRRTDGGVLGVIHFIGAIVSHRNGVAERCTLPISRGPSALIGADGRRLKVPLSRGDRTNRPENPHSYVALADGKASWGFAWLGSYCGAPASAIEIPLHHAGQASLRVPLHGPQPECKPSAGSSTLIDGVSGFPGQPVQPPRPEYSSLRLTGQIEPGTTGDQLAPIDLTLRTVGSAPVTLDPCPAYAGRDGGTAHTGGFGAPISTGYLPCTKRAAVIRPGHPLHWTIPATSFMQSGPGSAAIPGSTVYVQLGIAGVPPLRLKTTAGR
jgi:hypothetical protein